MIRNFIARLAYLVWYKHHPWDGSVDKVSLPPLQEWDFGRTSWTAVIREASNPNAINHTGDWGMRTWLEHEAGAEATIEMGLDEFRAEMDKEAKR
jgi:hypothetical protein